MNAVTLVTGFAGSGTSRIAEFLHKKRGVPMATLLAAPQVGYPSSYIDWEDYTWVVMCGLETINSYRPGNYIQYIELRNKSHQNWGLKSPLIAPFLSTWKTAIRERGFEVQVIQAVRPYLDCQNSLMQNLSPDTASILKGWNSSHRYIYEDMLSDIKVPYGANLEEIL